MSDDQTFGQWIAGLREQLGLSREQLAAEAGVSTRTIDRCEEDTYMPRGKNLLRIFDVLGVNTSRPGPMRPMAAELGDIHRRLEEMSSLLGERGDSVSAEQLRAITETLLAATAKPMLDLLPELEEAAELIRQGAGVDERYAEKMTRIVAEAQALWKATRSAAEALEEQLRHARDESA